MQDVFVFLQKYEVWIYLGLGMIGVLYLRRVLIALQDWRAAVFGLEKEIAQRRFSAALTILIFIVLFAVAELVLVSFVVPTYQNSLPLPTSTLDLSATSTPFEAVGVASVVPMTPTAAIATAVAVTEQGCLPGQIEWVSPQENQEIVRSVELRGVINVQNLGFYKYEYMPIGSTVWTTIAGGNTPVIPGSAGMDDFLGEWNTSQLPAGDYLLRLVVFDNQNQPFPACVIPVRIIAVP
jgi:hypothetical protein